jgi:hypothetical protein
MKALHTKLIESLFVIGLLALPMSAMSAPSAPASNPSSVVPGTLNYVEGQASMNGEAVTAKSVGSATLEPGQSLETDRGKVEVLLTPGVFLRVGDESTVKMISPSITDTEVGIEKGQATLEVTEIHPQNYIRIDEDGYASQVLDTGFYDFDASHSLVRVLDGQALVTVGDKEVKVKHGHELDLSSLNASQKIKTQKFDKKQYEADNDLFRWSSLRSSYVAEANVDAARMFVDGGWWGPGWYWDPWFSCFTFIPGDGIFYSPFGWGFYSPWWVYEAPIAFYGHYYHHFGLDYRAWGPGGHYRPGPVVGSVHGAYGFRGGVRGGVRGGPTPAGGFHGGGFHGGGVHGFGR